jgi:anaerobic dimethyl sulfoxide reductase subunit B (iron-sulfur subunit)
MASYGLLIDYEYCSGCHSCEVACKQEHGFPVGKHGIRLYSDGPWQINERKTNWNKIPVPTDLCDLCADRVAQGRKPSCVHHCLCDVMRFGPLDELAIELARKDKQVLFAPRPNTSMDWREEADTETVAEKTLKAKGQFAAIEYSIADASKLGETGGLNKSYKLALHREEQKLDERQKIDE